jgi:hypothetical protein
MVAEARARAALADPPSGTSAISSAAAWRAPFASPSSQDSDRPGGANVSVTLVILDSDGATAASARRGQAPNVHRGLPLHLRGDVRVDGEPCPHAAVELGLRDARSGNLLPLGAMATGDDGAFAGAIVIPASTRLGDYEVIAHGLESAQCGGGAK